MYGLKKLYNFYFGRDASKKFFNIADATQIMLKDQVVLPITNIEAKYAIAYC